jgi:hypothetical protein
MIASTELYPHIRARRAEVKMQVYDYVRAGEEFSQTQRQRPTIRYLQIAPPRGFGTPLPGPSMRGATATKQSRPAEWIASLPLAMMEEFTPSRAMRGRAAGVAIVLRSGVSCAPILAKRHALSGWRGGRRTCQRPAHGQEQRDHRG